MQTLPEEVIEARDSAIHGRGVYARAQIEADTVVLEYTGERIDVREATRREQERRARAARGEEACDYLYVLDDDRVVDGREVGNVARLLNHACEPNCRSDVIDDRIWIIADRDIAAGEELTFDYGYTFRDGKGHVCRCGGPSCVGYIVARHQRWRVGRWRDAEAAKSTEAPRRPGSRGRRGRATAG